MTPGYEKVVAYYLQNIFLCENSEELYQLRLTFPTANFLSIAEKTFADEDRKIAAGKPTQRAGVFARKREITELSDECTALQTTLSGLNGERDTILAELEEQEKNHTELKEKISSAHIELVGNRKEREAIQLEVSRAQRDIENLQKEMLRLQDQVGTLREDLIRSREEQEKFKTELAEKQESRGALEVQAFESEEKLKLLQERKSGIQVESSRLSEKKNSLEYRFERVQSDEEHLNSRKETLLENRERDQQESEKILGQNAKFEVEKVEIADQRNDILARLSQLKEAFAQTFTELQDLQQGKSEWQKKREELLTQIQELELKLTQLQSNIDQIKAVSVERYQAEVKPIGEEVDLEREKLPMLMESQDEQWNFLSHEERLNTLEVHLTELREKASRYGEVNLTAIQEFDEVQKRFDFLTEQKTDLEKSIQILEEAIVKIDTSTLERFEDTFHAVNKKFQEIFPILFNGGKAELALTHAENILDAGIDILVHPPGKKPSSITLLSGGEKALTAVSLVLAIFARKPSPFCLLDEVDAPLDDANVSRFNTVVRKMAEKTQFILITHNKKTMEVAQALYGVTMERAGVSKMTSVRLN